MTVPEEVRFQRVFGRVFRVEDSHHTPSLSASNELEGRSLLGWTGPLTYVGEHTIIDPDGKWLPASLSIVDDWIAKVLAA